MYLAGGFLGLLLCALASASGFFGLRLAAARACGVAGWKPVFAIDQKPWANVSLGRRALFSLAGPFGSYLVAVLFFTAGLMLVGDASVDETSMRVRVVPSGPAAVSGIRDGDQIVSVDRVAIHDWPQLKAEVSKERGSDLPDVVVCRGDDLMSFKVMPNEDSVASIASEKAPPEVSGPIGIVRETGLARQSGSGQLLLLLGGLISYSLFLPLVLAAVFFPRTPRKR